MYSDLSSAYTGDEGAKLAPETVGDGSMLWALT